MKILIVDGSRENRLAFIEQIKPIEEISSIKQSISAEDALFNIFDFEPDLIISSETLSYRNGFSIAYILKKVEKEIPLIIVASDASHALTAIKANVFDYLIGSIDEIQLRKSVEKAIEYIKVKHYPQVKKKYEKNVKIRIGASNGYKLLELDSLAYCEADGSYTKIGYISGQSDFSTVYLGKINNILSKYHFIRLNRKVIVNMRLLSSIDRFKEKCYIKTNQELIEFKISKSYLRKLELDQIL